MYFLRRLYGRSQLLIIVMVYNFSVRSYLMFPHETISAESASSKHTKSLDNLVKQNISAQHHGAKLSF